MYEYILYIFNKRNLKMQGYLSIYNLQIIFYKQHIKTNLSYLLKLSELCSLKLNINHITKFSSHIFF